METQFMEIYRVEGQIYGYYIIPKPFNQLRKDYDHCFNLPGKTACFFLVTGDDTIRRDEAIAFAAAVASNRVVHYHIDLSSLGRSYVKEDKTKW